jgi:hypothetical protein
MKPVKRDYAQFPDDDNGNVLWDLRCHGDALRESREIDFTCIFPSEAAAIDFAVACLRSEFKVEMHKAEEHLPKDGLDWEVIVYTEAVPAHTTITQIEKSLDKRAAKGGGRASGWSAVFIGPG